MNVKFHENRENTGKILKISDVILWNLPFIYLFIFFLPFIFSRSHEKFSLVLLQMTNHIFEKCKKECNML